MEGVHRGAEVNLSHNFTLEEMVGSRDHPEIPNQPDSVILARLETLAWRMEQVRTILGNSPIHVSSGYRSPALNVAVKGSKTSVHLEGRACDFTCPKFGTPSNIVAALRHHIIELGIDQLILEYPNKPNGGWVHVGLREFEFCRFQALAYHGGDKYEVLV